MLVIERESGGRDFQLSRTVKLRNKLKNLWQRWQKVAKQIGDFQARLILSLFYILIVLPIGLIARMFSDPLALKKTAAHWDAKPSSPPRIDEARRQF
ncbi:MAG TPA: hypothetical protein VK200_17370 [Candidatus Limnocylindrales bacterium]|nr:hypothetical protein [Candidatus Limnocylindrales bacterium]